MTPPPGQGAPNAWMQLVPLVLIFAIFYFLLIRPARRRQKEVQSMLQALKAGDRVVTSGGLLGTVVAVDHDIVQLRIADKVKVDVTKSSVVGLQGAGPVAAPPET
jgi:preprotein translocase subunit YajC